jgi:molybdenum cofactor cytidylyltransferase
VTVGVLLLAAGRSVRFGSDKRLALLPDGKTVLEATLINIQASNLPVLVCLANGEDAAAKICDRMCVNFVVCENAKLGMGYTLAQGIVHISGWKGVLVALADMPFVQATTYSQLGKSLFADTIRRPQCDGRAGHPVAFGANYFGELAAHSGEDGARGLLSKYAAKVSTIECADPGVLRDIDRPSDLSSAQRKPLRM